MKLGRVIPYKIAITSSDNNGFVVKIGCGRFVFESVESLLDAFREYLFDSEAITERYNEATDSNSAGREIGRIRMPERPITTDRS